MAKAISNSTTLLFALLLMLCTTAVADSVQDKLKHAQDLAKASRWDKAIEAYNEIIEQLEGEQQAEAYYRLGYAHMRRYKGQEAIPVYENVLTHPDATPALKGGAQYTIGLCWAYEQDYEKAFEAYKKVDKIKDAEPDHICKAYTFSGYSLNKLERYDEAIEWLTKAGEMEDAHFVSRQTAYNSAANIHQDKGRYEQAIALYKKSLELGERSSYGHQATIRLIECETALSGSDAFYIVPYVPSIGQDYARVCWISREGAPIGKVKVWEGGEVIAEVEAEKTMMKDIPDFRQQAHITGLKPGTQYRYEATCNNESHGGTFLTAPDDDRPIKFAVLGDTQGGHKRHAGVAASIAKFKPNFVIHVGDCVERGDRWDEWKVQLFDPGYAYLTDSPLFVARGNHDGGPYFRIFFARDERLFEDYRFGDVHVFLMDSQSSMGGSAKTAQMKWLEEGLSQSDAKWKVIALHHPMIHVAYPWKPVGQDEFLPILEEHGADIVLTGHYHIYQKLIPIGKPGKKPIMHITSGGGGGNMGNKTPCPLVIEDYMDLHHLRFVCDGDTLNMKVITPEGELIDEMNLDHTKHDDPDSIMQKKIDRETAMQVRLVYQNLSNPNYRRDEWFIAPTSAVAKGEEVTMEIAHTMLDIKKLPAETKLVIKSAEESPWKIEEQTINIGAGEFTFKAIAPENVEVQESQIRPNINAIVTLKVKDRLFEPEFVLMAIKPE